MGSDDLPRAILTYANGQGYDDHFYVKDNQVTRKDLREMDMTDFYFKSPTTAPKDSETHSGADVGIFASGPFAHLFHGVHEQIFIYHVMAYSGCLDKYQNEEHCAPSNTETTTEHNQALALQISLFALVISFLCIIA